MHVECRRNVIKVTGKIFSGKKTACEPSQFLYVAGELKRAHDNDPICGMIVVPGGGNIPPGKEYAYGGGFSREAADQMGLIATLVNAIALACMCKNVGLDAKVFSEITTSFAQHYEPGFVEEALEAGKIVVHAGGTGREKLSTDAEAALLARQHKADAVYKGTVVDGVFDRDPNAPGIGKRAKLLRELTYDRAKNIGMLDNITLAVCEDGRIPICVFNITKPGGLAEAIGGKASSKIQV